MTGFIHLDPDSDPRWIWECGRKHSFRSPAAALKAIEKWSTAGSMDKSKVGVYACRFCGGYHIGHKRKAVEKPVSTVENV